MINSYKISLADLIHQLNHPTEEDLKGAEEVRKKILETRKHFPNGLILSREELADYLNRRASLSQGKQ
jgi:hypothetical protein